MPRYVQTSSVTMPYPGLRPFRRDESEIFFGREEQVAKLSKMLEEHHFVAVVGPSGCGKSSLVTAGLLPQLIDGYLLDTKSGWQEMTIRPGDHPIMRLAEGLVENDILARTVDGIADNVSRIGFLGASLRRGPLGLLKVLEEDRACDANILLVVDQFEEIFRFRHEKSDQEADAFVAMLLETVQQAEQRKLPFYVMLTMRSDYLGDCGQFASLPEAISESQFLTPRLTREQRHAAIVGPAAMFGGEVEPALVNRLLNDMEDEPDQLPIMQHALMRIWSRVTEFHDPGSEREEKVVLTTEVYEDLGGWEKTLSNHADEALADLGNDPRRQRVAEMLFRSLTKRRPGGSPIRRPVSVREVAAVAGPDISTALVKEVMEVFRHSDHHPDRSFVTPPAETKAELGDDDMLDISHESLIRQWNRLRDDWSAKEADSAEKYQLLLSTARQWNDGHAALWGTPNLEFTLEWWQSEQPSAAWAERYGDDYQLAKEFLDKSKIKQEHDEQQKEASRQRKLDEARQRAEEKEQEARKFRRIAGALGLTLILLCIAVAMAWWSQNEVKGLEWDKRVKAVQDYISYDLEKARRQWHELRDAPRDASVVFDVGVELAQALKESKSMNAEDFCVSLEQLQPSSPLQSAHRRLLHVDLKDPNRTLDVLSEAENELESWNPNEVTVKRLLAYVHKSRGALHYENARRQQQGSELAASEAEKAETEYQQGLKLYNELGAGSDSDTVTRMQVADFYYNLSLLHYFREPESREKLIKEFGVAASMYRELTHSHTGVRDFWVRLATCNYRIGELYKEVDVEAAANAYYTAMTAWDRLSELRNLNADERGWHSSAALFLGDSKSFFYRKATAILQSSSTPDPEMIAHAYGGLVDYHWGLLRTSETVEQGVAALRDALKVCDEGIGFLRQKTPGAGEAVVGGLTAKAKSIISQVAQHDALQREVDRLLSEDRLPFLEEAMESGANQSSAIPAPQT